MIDVDFLFYQDQYGGTRIPDEKSFQNPLIRANSHLSMAMTQTPDDSNMDLVKMCLCEITDMIYQDDINRAEHGGRELQSENTDGYSVTYATEAEAGKIAVNALDTKIYSVIRRWLSQTGLLYAGVVPYDNECCPHYF